MDTIDIHADILYHYQLSPTYIMENIFIQVMKFATM